jgi:hypothetical protein
MAIVIRGKTMCSLCDAILSDTDDIVMFPHFISVQTHPLWRFSDSAMHRSCFAGWPQAESFRAAFNEMWSKQMPRHPREMTADGSIIERDGAST